jgi:hypothetical protein
LGSGSGYPPSSPTFNSIGALMTLGSTLSGVSDGRVMLGMTTCSKRFRHGNTAEASLALGSRIHDTSTKALGGEEHSNGICYRGDDIIDLDLNRAKSGTTQPALSGSSDGSPSDGPSTDLDISQAESKLRALIEACNKLEQVD